MTLSSSSMQRLYIWTIWGDVCRSRDRRRPCSKVSKRTQQQTLFLSPYLWSASSIAIWNNFRYPRITLYINSIIFIDDLRMLEIVSRVVWRCSITFAGKNIIRSGQKKRKKNNGPRQQRMFFNTKSSPAKGDRPGAASGIYICRTFIWKPRGSPLDLNAYHHISSNLGKKRKKKKDLFL